MYRRNRVVVEAPAKINLFLDITGTAPNGYHLLDTIMQAVDLCDVVTVGRCSAPGIRITCSRPGVPEDSSNLAHKAAAAFFGALSLPPMGLHIHMDKAVPAQAGLGGGSADAAAVLVGLNQLLATGLGVDALCSMGLALGADVPFAILGGCARAQGVGEAMTALLPGLPHCWLVIAKPAAGVSTQEAYARYDSMVDIQPRSSDAIRAAIAAGNLAGVGDAMFNVFQQVEVSPDTGRLVSTLRQCGAVGAALSGSGSAVVGLFATREDAQAAVSATQQQGEEVFLAAPVAYGARIVHQS